METLSTTVKCFHLWYDVFQYENNSYELCNVCRGLISKQHESFGGGTEGIKEGLHSDRSFGIKWHNMAEPAMSDRLMKGPVRFVEM